MEAKIYTMKGAEAGKVSLDAEVFGLGWNADLVHQVVTSMMSTARNPIAHVKTRGEVRGGGKKPWRQKGTGRARHGSTRSPIWVGGGVTHGPRNDKNFDRKVNRKMKAKALYVILSKKWKDGEILFVDTMSFAEPKAKDAKAALVALSGIKGFDTLASKRKNAALLATGSKNRNAEKSFGNFGSVLVDELRNINPVDALNYKYLIIENPKESLKAIAAKLG
jgi:large subunit ribosomal protein L4